MAARLTPEEARDRLRTAARRIDRKRSSSPGRRMLAWGAAGFLAGAVPPLRRMALRAVRLLVRLDRRRR